MVIDPLTGSLRPLNFEKLLENIPELNQFDVDIEVISVANPIDSSNVGLKEWLAIAEMIEQNYDRVDGFVILHGTDTLSYTASVLSFMLDGLRKPVVLTGSQLPIGRLRTDGKENLISAIEIASRSSLDGHLIQEVVIYFESTLFRGNRTVKVSAEHFHAFNSPNYPVLAKAGVNIIYDRHVFLPRETKAFKVRKELDDNVAVMRIFPGMKASYVDAILSIEGLRGLVIESFGAGNTPSFPWLMSRLKKATDSGIRIVNVTQCLTGFVMQGMYEVSGGLNEIGVISGGDMTTEAALAKLMHLLPQKLDVVEFERMYTKPLKGERTGQSALL